MLLEELFRRPTLSQDRRIIPPFDGMLLFDDVTGMGGRMLPHLTLLCDCSRKMVLLDFAPTGKWILALTRLCKSYDPPPEERSAQVGRIVTAPACLIYLRRKIIPFNFGPRGKWVQP